MRELLSGDDYSLLCELVKAEHLDAADASGEAIDDPKIDNKVFKSVDAMIVAVGKARPLAALRMATEELLLCAYSIAGLSRREELAVTLPRFIEARERLQTMLDAPSNPLTPIARIYRQRTDRLVRVGTRSATSCVEMVRDIGNSIALRIALDLGVDPLKTLALPVGWLDTLCEAWTRKPVTIQRKPDAKNVKKPRKGSEADKIVKCYNRQPADREVIAERVGCGVENVSTALGRYEHLLVQPRKA